MQILYSNPANFSMRNQKSNQANLPSFKAGLSATPEAVKFYQEAVNKKGREYIQQGFKKIEKDGIRVFFKPYEHQDIKDLISIHIMPKNVDNFLNKELPYAWKKLTSHITGKTEINLRKDGNDVEYVFSDSDANTVGGLGSICGHPEIVADKDILTRDNELKKDFLDYNLMVLNINHTYPNLNTDVESVFTSKYNPVIKKAFENLLYDMDKRKAVVEEVLDTKK